jgi:outer membrane lipoprotein
METFSMRTALFLLLPAILVAGCAGSPFDTAGREIAELSPAAAADRPSRAGATVIWGGRIVGVVNAGEFTELEILSLPLGPGQRPKREADGGQRFLIRRPGFLEPMTWAPGRFVTALGRFTGIESRSVGAFPVDHPVLVADQLELWPVQPNSRRADIHFGVGVRL